MLHGLVDHLDISDLIKNGTAERFREMVERTTGLLIKNIKGKKLYK